MRGTPASQYRIAVIYDGACGPTAHRAAVEIAATAWDAGSSIRVRRIGHLLLRDPLRSLADRRAMLDAVADVPQVCSEDLEWANVMLLVSDE